MPTWDAREPFGDAQKWIEGLRKPCSEASEGGRETAHKVTIHRVGILEFDIHVFEHHFPTILFLLSSPFHIHEDHAAFSFLQTLSQLQSSQTL
jgi:hypothetical protein